jgi:hypothetical protein
MGYNETTERSIMRDRALQVRLVKTNTTSTEQLPAETDESYADLLDATVYRVEDLMAKAALYVVGYMVLDTVRKVIIAQAQK